MGSVAAKILNSPGGRPQTGAEMMQSRGFTFQKGLDPSAASNFKAQGDTLSAGATSTDMAPTQIYSWVKDTPDFMGEEKVASLTDIFNRRLAQIKEKSSRPGLLLTRGEK